jgi:hypothetical protein
LIIFLVYTWNMVSTTCNKQNIVLFISIKMSSNTNIRIEKAKFYHLIQLTHIKKIYLKSNVKVHLIKHDERINIWTIQLAFAFLRLTNRERKKERTLIIWLVYLLQVFFNPTLISIIILLSFVSMQLHHLVDFPPFFFVKKRINMN